MAKSVGLSMTIQLPIHTKLLWNRRVQLLTVKSTSRHRDSAVQSTMAAQKQLTSVYRELLPPNTLEHAVWANVLGPNSQSLVVARPTSLSIYSLKPAVREVSTIFRRLLLPPVSVI
jgi:hypothetical protein